MLAGPLAFERRGRAALALIGKVPAQEVPANLNRLKELLETGKVTNASGAVLGKFSWSFDCFRPAFNVRIERSSNLETANDLFASALARCYVQQLRDVLGRAEVDRAAIGHFNVADWVLLKAAFDSARELNVPVIVGASDGERKFMGLRQIAAVVRSLREEFDFPIFLNADHTHSLSDAVKAAEAGFDAVVFDASALPFEQNVRNTREAVEALKSVNPAILVEGELGDIGTGSEIHQKAPDLSKGLTSPAQAKAFVDATGVDILAPAVGNMHGMLTSMVEGQEKKHLDIARIADIKRSTGSLLTLHGGSGTDDDDLRNAIEAGINIVHINTELRVAWRDGLEQALAREPAEIVPYRILPLAVHSVEEVVRSRMSLFSAREIQTKG